MVRQLLKVTVLRATNILAKNSDGSDVYCKVKTIEKGRTRIRGEKKTAVQKKTTNPVWDETIVLKVSARSIALRLSLWHSARSDVFLGEAKVSLSELQIDTEVSKKLLLLGKSDKDGDITGSLEVTLFLSGEQDGLGGDSLTLSAETSVVINDEPEFAQLYSSVDYEPGFIDLDAAKMKKIIGTTLPISAARFFSMFWGEENEHQDKYHQVRSDKNLAITAWAPHQTFGHTRELSYLSPVNAPIGPKETRIEESQRYVLKKNELTVETKVNALDVPYGDYFIVESQWTVKAAPGGIKVEVFLGLNFSKSTVLKGKIESSTIKGYKQSIGQWFDIARKDVKDLVGAEAVEEHEDDEEEETSSSTGGGLLSSLPSLPLKTVITVTGGLLFLGLFIHSWLGFWSLRQDVANISLAIQAQANLVADQHKQLEELIQTLEKLMQVIARPAFNKD